MRFSFRLFSLIITTFLTACTVSVSIPTLPPDAQAQNNTPPLIVYPTSTSQIPPNPTSTRKPRPTPTPAATPISDDIPNPITTYQLTNWTAEKADLLIDNLILYPEALRTQFPEIIYLSSFRYAAIAQSVAALQFPDAEQKEQWLWDSAYYSALAGDESARDAYIHLLADSLNNQTTTINDLADWFHQKYPDMKLSLTPATIETSPGSDWIILIEQMKSYWNGSAYLWLIQENDLYTIIPLQGNTDFTLQSHRESPNLEWLDISGDASPEAIIYQPFYNPGFTYSYCCLDIFDMSQQPPKQILWEALPPHVNLTTLSVSLANTIILKYQPEGCAGIEATWEYQIQNEILRLKNINWADQNGASVSQVCSDTIISDLYRYREDEIPALMTRLEQYFSNYSGADPSIEEMRFDYALFLATLQETGRAREQLQAIVATSDTNNLWAESAKRFLSVYQTQDDLFEAFLEIKYYPQNLGVQEIVEMIRPEKLNEIPALLTEMGWTITDSGLYDFNSDEQPELWFFMPMMNFYIVNKVGDRLEISVVYTQTFSDPDLELDIESVPSIFPLPKFRVNKGGEPFTGEFYWFTTESLHKPISEAQVRWSLRNISDGLYSGNLSPDEALSKLTELQNTPIQWSTSLSENIFGISPSDGILAELLYNQGLAYELSGNTDRAAQTYLELWQRFPESPYSVMARARLEPVD